MAGPGMTGTLDEVECDLVVPGAATRRDWTHQFKLLK